MKHFEIVELADAGREAEWQTYVESTPHASMYHALEWRHVLRRAFGHRSWYLMAQDDGGTRGVLPLVEMKSSLFGHFFVSLPFLDYGGILADTPECEAALATAAAALAAKRGAHHIELRQSFAAAGCAEAGWALRQHKASLVIPLDVEPDTRWSALSSRLRGKVRKAEKSGAIVFGRNDRRTRRLLSRIRPEYAGSGNAGLQPDILSECPPRSAKDAAVLLVRHDGRPAAGAIALRRGERVELPWICSDYSQSSLNVNEYLYWNAIQWALQLGRP